MLLRLGIFDIVCCLNQVWFDVVFCHNHVWFNIYVISSYGLIYCIIIIKYCLKERREERKGGQRERREREKERKKEREKERERERIERETTEAESILCGSKLILYFSFFLK